MPINVQDFSEFSKRLGSRCFYCDKPSSLTAEKWEDRLTQDHLFASSNGGADNLWNIVPACGQCNSIKQGRDIWEFLADRSAFRATVEKNAALLTSILLLGHLPSSERHRRTRLSEARAKGLRCFAQHPLEIWEPRLTWEEVYNRRAWIDYEISSASLFTSPKSRLEACQKGNEHLVAHTLAIAQLKACGMVNERKIPKSEKTGGELQAEVSRGE